MIMLDVKLFCSQKPSPFNDSAHICEFLIYAMDRLIRRLPPLIRLRWALFAPLVFLFVFSFFKH